MNTKIINIFGASGSGKSTFAAFLFSKLKSNGIDCELVAEFAKELVWGERKDVFEDNLNQFYIGATQFFRMNSMIGKVDVLITDSPILLSSVYNRSPILGDRYNEIIVELQHKFDSGINYLMERSYPYVQNGRNETPEEALKIHEKVKKLLDDNGFKYRTVKGSNQIFEDEFEKLMSNKILKELD